MANNIVAENEIFFTAFEPKLTNRFLFLVEGIPTFMIRGADRPELQQESVSVPHINTVRFVKGISVWQEMELTLYDAITPSGAQAVMEWVRLHHESVTGRDGYAEFYKKDCVIQVLGPVGDKVEEWILKGCQIVNADFGALEYVDSNASTLEITLTIQPDYCVLNY
jgi:hypothetical protein